MLISLSRFMAKSAQHVFPFFKLLHKEAAFEWTEECELALLHLKQALSEPPVLSRPDKGETLHLYLVVASEAVSIYKEKITRVKNDILVRLINWM